MGRLLNGVLIGVGIGLLIAPMPGEEMRRLLSQRFQELRSSLPENEQLKQYTQQVTDRVSQTSSNLKDYTQQAASKVKDTGSTLGNLAQKSATQVKQTGQDVASTTKQTAKSVQQGKQSPRMTTDEAAVDEIIPVDTIAPYEGAGDRTLEP